MQRSFLSFLLFASLLFLFNSCSPKSLSLAGDWGFKIDKNDVGQAEKWFGSKLDGSIQLPGSMASNNLGDTITLDTKWVGGMRNPNWVTDPNYSPYHDPENVRLPYWLQPEKKYMGAAWYQKEINIPKGWNSNTILLYLERVHWESTLWFDDVELGMKNSLATSHEYTIKDLATPGKHLITIKVDNRTKDIDVGRDSHSISDHTQSNWNGIVGEIMITPVAAVQFSTLRITSNISTKSIRVTGGIVVSKEDIQGAKVTGKVIGRDSELPIEPFSLDLKTGNNSFDFDLSIGKAALLWDEFDPNLYTLELQVKAGKAKDNISETFGLRSIEANENGIFVNGNPTFLRGTLECAIFPLTGYPSTDPEEWKRIMLIVKDHGLNHIRFHSWCPPEAAFIAADETGVYLQAECSSWANSSTTIGDGYPIDQYIKDEAQQIIDKYGNHPSFVMMAYGNEPAGSLQVKYLTDFVSHWKKDDPRRLYTSAGGWPKLGVNDYHNVPQPRIQGWGEQLNSIINSQPPNSSYDWSNKIDNPRVPDSLSTRPRIPTVSHEIGQWCVYPNLREIEKYTGVLKAKNFEIFKESLEAHKMAHLADSFLLASGKLQTLCYKADIEAALRTQNFGGFQLLDLHDFPGQGTALVGILDPFWGEKGYVSPEEFRQFCNTTVPLARLEKHIYLEGESMVVPIQVARYEKTQDLRPKTQIRLKNEDGKTEVEKELVDFALEAGNGNFIGEFKHTFAKTNTARRMTLEVSVGTFTNSWNIYIYPQVLSPRVPESLIITDLNKETVAQLENGATFLLSLGKGKVDSAYGGEVGVGFSSIFWNTAWTGGQKPHTLGILCNPDHPGLSEFPTDYHSDWQWWDAMANADAILLDNWASGHTPIVRIIDDWVTNRQLALVVEAKVGKGKIIISGADLHSDLKNRPAARQLRNSLLKYMESDSFTPSLELNRSTLQAIPNH